MGPIPPKSKPYKRAKGFFVVNMCTEKSNKRCEGVTMNQKQCVSTLHFCIEAREEEEGGKEGWIDRIFSVRLSC